MESNLFDHKVMYDCLQQVLLKIEDPATQPFLAMLSETLKIFKQMGGTLAMAFEDIQQKIDIINRSMRGLVLFASCPENAGLFTLMEHEIKENVHILNGENWEQVGDRNPNYRNFESISRTIVRILWFLNFVRVLFDGLYNDRKKYGSTCCSYAYSQAFGEKHSFKIRVLAKGAMLMAPSRSRMLEIFIGENNETKAYSVINQIRESLAILCDCLGQFLINNKLENLP